jgi:predicted permease
MLRDVRHGFRALLRTPGWTAVVVLSLALGIGANTALFSAINALFLKTVAVDDPESLVRFRFAGRNDAVTSSSDYGFTRKDPSGQDVRTTFSYPMFQAFVAGNTTMTDLVACAPYQRINVVVDGHADIANAFITSGNYYRMLGLTANPGRTIVPDDDRPDAAPVAVISPRYWRTRFAADPQAIGKSVRINNVPVTIVGVISPQFVDMQAAIDEPPDIAVTLAMEARLNTTGPPPGQANIPRINNATYWWLQVVGRVKPGVSPAQVQANLENAFRNTARTHLDAYLAGLTPEARSTSTNRNRSEIPRLIVDSGSHGVYDVRTTDTSSVTMLSVAVVLVLLIVCANVANLLLSRATARQKEISVRLSLGATRGRLIRQLLIESLLLASIGGALGVLVGQWGQQLLPGGAGQPAPLDWRVLAFALGVTGATGVLFGIAPAFRATSVNVSAALKETSRSVAGSRSILSRALVVVQVAVSLVLLVAAGLLMQTLQNLRNADVGFNTQNLVLFRINPSLNGYDERRVMAIFDDIAARLRAIPGARSVALSNMPLLSGGTNSTSIFVAGRTYAPNARASINRLVVTPTFFATMEMPLKTGRAFTERDNQTSQKVAIVNDAAVQKYFPGENPIGQHIGSSLETSNQIEIVGVLRDAKYASVREPPPPTMYVPQLQNRPGQGIFQVRTAGDPASMVGAIRDAVRQVDPDVPLMDVATQVEQVEKRLAQERVFAQAYAMFGALAMLIASIGIFGLMSYNVSRRTNEIGVRMALGAQTREVLRLVLVESMILVVVGVAIGLATALAAGRLVASMLFGLAPTDAATIAVAMAVMLGVAAVAGYVPARRAARVDPLVALRYE